VLGILYFCGYYKKNVAPMKLIGVRIDQNNTEDTVKKNLKEEWYPFLNSYVFEEKELIDTISGQAISDEIFLEKIKNNSEIQKNQDFIYNTTEDSPPITIHSIVGKNGSGKSTILEILFRIINNFAFKTIGGEDSNDLLEAKDVSASLFYSLSIENEKNIIYCLACKQSKSNNKMTVKLFGTDGTSLECNEQEPKLSNHIEYLEKFFYTVVVNYSHYSFNTIEVDGLKPGEYGNMYDDNDRPLFYKNGNPAQEIQYPHWLNGLFHKNDGYLTPIVLNPMRTTGNFDVNREQGLSKQRLTGILIMNPEFLVEYKALELQFEFNLKRFQLKIEKQSLAYSPDEYMSLLLDIYTKWAHKLNVKSTLLEYNKPFSGGGFKSQDLSDLSVLFRCLKENMTSLEIQLHTTLLYLSYKSISISTKYLSFQNDLKTNEKRDKIIEDTYIDPSHISLKIRQAKNHIQNRLLDSTTGHLIPEKPGRNDDFITISIDSFIVDNHLEERKIDKIFDNLYPANYNTEVLLQKENEIPITLNFMSSGERQMLYSLSSVLYHLINLQSVEPDNMHRFRYSHINILLDEVEMYYHPEYQRQFVYKLITLIERLNLNKDKIKSINICIITHSPFLLSDISKNNILFLKDGTVANKEVKGETFGANVFDILKNGFFLETSVGDYFIRKIQSIINEINSHKKNDTSFTKGRYKELSAIVKRIGEPLLRNKIQSMLDGMFFDKKNINELNNEIRQLESRLKELKNKEEML
jgi:predicted ATP-binding protein involved in virulence